MCVCERERETEFWCVSLCVCVCGMEHKATLSSVKHSLATQYPRLGSLMRGSAVAFAVNEEYAAVTAPMSNEDEEDALLAGVPLRDGDVVAVLPPVSGG